MKIVEIIPQCDSREEWVLAVMENETGLCRAGVEKTLLNIPRIFGVYLGDDNAKSSKILKNIYLIDLRLRASMLPQEIADYKFNIGDTVISRESFDDTIFSCAEFSQEDSPCNVLAPEIELSSREIRRMVSFFPTLITGVDNNCVIGVVNNFNVRLRKDFILPTSVTGGLLV